jgi:hypothetical protein
MAKEIGVDGLTIGHGIGSTCSGGTFTITSVPSLKVKAGGKGVYKGTLSFTWSGGNHIGGVPATALGSGTINFSSSKVKADNQFVIRLDDTGTMSGTYTQPGSPPVPGILFSNQPVKISNAGQTVVKAE